ncbi:MAG TPA: hypothetical protein VGM62_03950 [Chthoniobacterales bacterium]
MIAVYPPVAGLLLLGFDYDYEHDRGVGGSPMNALPVERLAVASSDHWPAANATKRKCRTATWGCCPAFSRCAAKTELCVTS